MFKQIKDQTISKAIFLFSFLVIFLLIAAFAAFWAYHESGRFHAKSQAIENALYQQYQDQIKKEVIDVLEYIRYKRTQVLARTKEQLRKRVYEAHQVAQKLYRKHRGDLSDESIQQLIIRTLRPFRFGNGKGYYFIGRLDGTELLYPPKPHLEGKNLYHLRDKQGNYVIQAEVQTVQNQGEGFVRGYWQKPGQAEGKSYPKLSFVKGFAPYDWYIGTGAYLDDMEETIKAEVLARIQAIRFGQEGAIGVFQDNGVCLSHPNESYIGKNLLDMTDPKGVPVNRELLEAARAGGGYVSYQRKSTESGKPLPHLAYARAYTPWQWMVCADAGLEAVKKAAATQLAQYRADVKKEAIFTLGIFLVALVLAILFARAISSRIQKGIGVFVEFFKQAAVSYQTIDENRLAFLEFKQMAGFANQMAADRKQAEEQLRQSEAILRQLADNLREVLYVYDPVANRFLFVSAAYETVWEMPVEQVMEKPTAFAERVHPQDWAVFEQAVRQEQEAEAYFNLEYRIVMPDGRVKWIWARNLPVRGDNGAPWRTVGIAEDITERKSAQNLLAEREAQFRTIFDHSPQPMALTRVETGEIIQVNDAFCAKVEGAKAQIIGRTVIDLGFYSPADRKVFTDWLHEKGMVEGLEMRFISLTGTPLVARMFSKFIRIHAQEYLLTMFEDITEKKEAQNRLLKQKEQFELAVKGSNDGIFDWDIGSGDLFLSPKWKEQLGYADEELKNEVQTFWGLLYEPDQVRVADHIQRYLNGEMEGYDLEFRMKHKDGGYRWIRSRGEALWDEAGRPYRMAGSHTDITERKQYRIELQEKENLLSSIIDTLPGTLNVVDTDYNIIRLNRIEYRMKLAGVDRIEDLIGQKCYQVFMKRDRPCPWCNIQEVIKTGRSVEELTAPGDPRERATGKALHVMLAPIKNDKGEVTGVVEYGIDVTELRDAKNRAEAASQAKSEFLANMSHEIRTPMNGVIGMTGLLLDTPLNPEQQRYAETIRASADALLDIINDILDFSKIEAGRMEMERLDFDLSELLDGFAEVLALKAHEKGLEFICSAAPAVPRFLRGDPGRLRQVLMNLAGNAVKFTRQGEIAVRAELEAEAGDQVLLRFTVRDTGIGIPGEKQKSLFDPFTQADASITREHGGTGLGLAISRQLAEMMGGTIGVRSQQGEGTRFWFTVWLEKQAAPGAEEPTPPTDLRGTRILVVDDNATNREILLEQLRAWGVRPEEAPDGPTALACLRRAVKAKAPYAAAVIDMQMPGMSGRELGRAIKAEAALAETPLLMMSSLDRQRDVQEMNRIGFAACLTKPVRSEALFESLSAALSLPSAPQAAADPARPAIPQWRPGTVRVLLAEDNIVNQQVAAGILKKLGITVDTVANGAEAVQALQSTPYDLVLMDLQMPETDGLEASRIIRDPGSGVRDPRVPIVAMTAHALESDREQCLQAGMNDYLAKPVSPEALAEVLERWLPGERQNQGHATASSESRSETGEPVWEKEALLNRLSGNQALAEAIVEQFLSDMPEQLARLRVQVREGQAEQAGKQAHTIKGVAANLSSPALERIAESMEKAGKEGDLERLPPLMAQMEAIFAQVESAMQEKGTEK